MDTSKVSPDTIIALNDLYQSAFSDLIVIVAMMLGFAGVLLPLGLAVLQSRMQKKEGLLAREKLVAEVQKIREEVRIEILEDQAKSLNAFQERSDKVISDLKAKIDSDLLVLKANAFHVQAQGALHRESYLVALKSSCDAVPGYLKGSEHGNLRRVITHIAVVSLKNLTNSSFERFQEIPIDCHNVIKMLRESDETGSFHDLIGEFEYELKKCLERDLQEAEG